MIATCIMSFTVDIVTRGYREDSVPSPRKKKEVAQQEIGSKSP